MQGSRGSARKDSSSCMDTQPAAHHCPNAECTSAQCCTQPQSRGCRNAVSEDRAGRGGSPHSCNFETPKRRQGCGSCWQKPDKPIKVVAAEGSQLAVSWRVISAIINNCFLILPFLHIDSAQDVTRTLTLCSKPERAK